ncbi:GerMN domain-containing protein [Treponema sp. Marseille-Q4130]|uniref:GerMN domain-containing protein n=1 Tax=Treponema sp. Marseille-Q4130 TaxID=2766702 RepID=UPI001651D7FB|nr:GerMN domain-containing protein [Treponema sp. Marseille-Q4130]MBC6720980.1 GerMN domain-containing protein [Treponema sp. Marseille-Q4130]
MAERNTKKKNTGFAFACWLLVALILLVFFFVKKDTILSNLQNTDFFGRVFGKTPEFVQNHEQKQNPKSGGDAFQIDILPEANSTEPSVTENNRSNLAKQNESTAQKPASVPDAQKPADRSNAEKSGETKAEEKPKTDTRNADKTQSPKSVLQPAATINVPLCFVVIGSDGSVSRQIVTRKLPKSDSPLTDTLNSLLAGPSAEEKARNTMTLIPSGTKLLGASVKNGIATLNFSEAFSFNSVGVQGYLAQLMQIVYTATSFSTVNSVQFIIEGQREDYLGSEGTWIGSPLSRSSF